MAEQAPSTSGPRPEPEYVPIAEDGMTAEELMAQPSKPTAKFFDLVEKVGSKPLSETLKEIEDWLDKDPQAEGTASIKMWRPGLLVGRDAAMLIAQKATRARLAVKYVLAVGAYLEKYYGMQATELYTEQAPGQRPAHGGQGGQRGGPPQRSQSNRYPKAGPGEHAVTEVKIIDIQGTRYLTAKTAAGEAKTKLSFLEKQGHAFYGWAIKTAYQPNAEMAKIVVEREGFIARFIGADD